MANLLAILALGLQYATVILVIDLFVGKALPLWAIVAIFVVLVIAGFVVWNTKESAEKIEEWRKLTISSLIIGVGFFGWDAFLAYQHGQANPLRFTGGPLGLSLTLAVCPGFTSICVAGMVRAFYLSRIREA
jgi:hypothetical protein